MNRPNAMPFCAEALEPRRMLSTVPPNLAYVLKTYPAGTDTDINVALARGTFYLAGQLLDLDRSDGTAAGTSPLGRARSSGMFLWDDVLMVDTYYGAIPLPDREHLQPTEAMFPSHFVPLGDRLFYRGWTYSSERVEGVYVRDRSTHITRFLRHGAPLGTIGGRVVIADLPAASESRVPALLLSDGTPEGTVSIKNDFRVRGGIALDEHTFLLDGPGGLWKTDGTGAGTVLVRAGVGAVSEWKRVGGTTYFLADGLWKTDGTEAGTVRIADAASAAPDSPDKALADAEGVLYFVGPASDGTRELFAVAGSQPPRQVTDFPGDVTVTPALAATAGRVFFPAANGTGDSDLWLTDGTTGDYHRVPLPGDAADREDTFENLHGLAGSLFFTRQSNGEFVELMRYGAAPAALEGDTLVLNGSDPAEGTGVPGDDAFLIGLDDAGEAIAARVNGVTFTWPRAAVREIVVNAFGGDDTLDLATDAPLTIRYNASAGHESLTLAGTESPDGMYATAYRIDVRRRIQMDGSGDRQWFHFDGLDELTLRMLGGNDGLTLWRGPADRVIVDTGDGDDHLLFQPLHDDPRSGPPSDVTALAGDGSDYLLLQAHGAIDRYHVTDHSFSLSGGTAGTVTSAFSGFEDIYFQGRPASDFIYFTPSAFADIYIEGGSASLGDPPGTDALIPVLDGAAGAVFHPGEEAGRGRYTFDNRVEVTFADIEVPDDFRTPAATAGRRLPAAADVRLEFTFNEPVLVPVLRDALRLVNLSTGDVVGGESIVRTELNPATRTVVFTVSVVSGPYQVTLPPGAVTDYAGNPTTDSLSFTFETAPRVAAVFVDGTAWSAGFRANLGARRLGDAVFGFALRKYQTTLPPLPWVNTNRVNVRFDGPVVVSADDLVLRGANTPLPAMSEFDYDPATFTASWTLASPLRADKYLIDIDADTDGVRGAATGGRPGLPLDGEVSSSLRGSGFPSGNGLPGGDFRLRFDALPGDANGDFIVNARDSAPVRTSQRRAANAGAAGAYPYRSDLNADGRINALDTALVRSRYLARLPTAEPVASIQSAPALRPAPGLRRPYERTPADDILRPG